MNEIMWCIIWAFMGFHTITDLARKTVIWPICAGMMAVGTIIQIWKKGMTWESWIMGILLGLGIILISILSQGTIGMGDGIVILVLGIWLGGSLTATACVFASLFAGIVALYLLIFKRKSRTYKMPFVPFLLLGLVVTRLSL